MWKSIIIQVKSLWDCLTCGKHMADCSCAALGNDCAR